MHCIIIIVFVCSAGVGRSGSYIAIDYTIEKIRQDKEIDLFNLVYEMRQSRPSMVQTEVLCLCLLMQRSEQHV